MFSKEDTQSRVTTSDNWDKERRSMVETQIAGRGIKDKAILRGMLSVPRHLFVPEHLQSDAYDDSPLPIENGQTISQPYIVALMAEALQLGPTDRVLEIGTGSGYAAAVLSRIVSQVCTIERHDIMAAKAREQFDRLNYNNIEVLVGDGTEGWPGKPLFDGIQVTAGSPGIPLSLCEQLKPEGNLVIPIGDRTFQEMMRIRRTSDGFYVREKLGVVRFVPLVGAEGWEIED